MTSSQGFWLEVDGGVAHVYGNRNMPEATKDALRAVIRAAKEIPIEPAWGIDGLHKGEWHRIAYGSEKRMRSQVERLIAQSGNYYRLVNPEGAQVSL